MKLKVKMSMKILVTFSSTKSKYRQISFGKMKDDTAGVATEELVGLKPKMYSFLVDDNSEHKKEMGVNKNFVLLNQNCLRHSMNRIKKSQIRNL